MKNEKFEDAARELDNMTREGFFGDQSAQLLQQKDSETVEQQNYNFFISLYDGVLDKDELNKFIKKFKQLFDAALDVDQEETIQIIISSIKGTDDNPELETLTSYLGYIENHMIMKNDFNKANSENDKSNETRRRLSKTLLADFTDGYEYDMKICAFVLGLFQIINGKNVDLKANTELASSNKLN